MDDKKYESPIDEDILDYLDKTLEDNPEYQAWVNKEDPIEESDDEGIWIPLKREDLDQAREMSRLHPDEDLKEKTYLHLLAVFALTRYLDCHGIKVDPINPVPTILKRLVPNAEVEAPGLGKIEAVILSQSKKEKAIEIEMKPGTMGYILTKLEEREAFLRGLFLKSDIHPYWINGCPIPVYLARPTSDLWDKFNG